VVTGGAVVVDDVVVDDLVVVVDGSVVGGSEVGGFLVGGSVTSGSVVVCSDVEVVDGARCAVVVVAGTVGRVGVVVWAARAVLHPPSTSAARTPTAADERMPCRSARGGCCHGVLTPRERYVVSRSALRHPAGTRTNADSSRFLFHKARSRSTQ